MAFQGSASPVVTLSSRDTQLSDTGAVYTVTMPTPGTAIAGHTAPTTFDQTKAYLYLYNAGPLSIYPANLRMKLTVAATSSTTVRFTQVIDKGTNRWSSGGTALTPLNANMLAGNTSGAAGNNSLLAGAVVLTAASGTARTIADHQYRSVIGVVGDTYSFVWGAPTTGVITAVPTTGTLVADITVGYPSIVVPPNCMFAIHQWSASQAAAPSFEFEFDYFEK